MTDHAELRRVAALAHPDAEWFIARNLDHPNIDKPAASFIATAAPKTVLALLDEIDGLRSRLEIDERTPHDGIACRDETIKVLDEKCDRLKAENCAHKDTQKHCELLEQYLKECASALPGTYYMDPPDGGDVSIPEQIRRMAKDAARYRWLRERDLETIRQGGVFAGMTPENIVLNQEDLDAAIDAALEGATQ
ncbi:ead/Ea22-like family protein [Pseudomonas aeruginosa]|uniref:ead/Ea22-like family protein n=1 Tax=Pseudomonas aeruginosa TaxID=287 RepID=UPI002E176E91|nr:ead/Ea22-like family protein [Pseudomonas aeruginosa]